MLVPCVGVIKLGFVMIAALGNTWPLLMGLMFLMIGNGLQGTLLGIRGGIEGFSTLEMSIVMSAYFLGFLGGSRIAPKMIGRVGHVRVFAALASFVSAVLILFPTIANPWAWFIGRVIVGFCFSGIYVTAESWLNNAATNQTRGQLLSAYMIVQMVGIVTAQWMLNWGDPSGYVLFVMASVLVSISFAPILLSINPTPAFDTTKPMTLRRLLKVSPLGVIGMLLLGGVFSAQFGMSSVFGSAAGLSVSEISIFVAMFFVGASITQLPIGWLSDRMDRRRLILLVALISGVGAVVGFFAEGSFPMLLVSAFTIGGTTNPLYSLLIAHTNDFLERDDMAAASGGLIFVNGIGAVSGPIAAGWIMEKTGAYSFFMVIAILLFLLVLYAIYRMTQRPAPSLEEIASYTPISPSGSQVLLEIAQEHDFERENQS